MWHVNFNPLMYIHQQYYRSIWPAPGRPEVVCIFDQRFLPFEVKVVELIAPEDFERAVREMYVRGAPLIGATAAYGVCAVLREAGAGSESAFETRLEAGLEALRQSRPTAVDLFHAIDRVMAAARAAGNDPDAMLAAARQTADALIDESAGQCRLIGEHGLSLIEEAARRHPNRPVNVLTHCNAGWLACIDYGTATAPIYLAHQKGIPVHVWVDETRPRNQGAGLTAFELGQAGVPHTVIVDNAGGHLMQHGLVDLVLVGTDRTTRRGDVANKIGTYLKALAAYDNGVPFYVAAPSTSIDWSISDGLAEIPIETRTPDEVSYVHGWDGKAFGKVRVTPPESPALNYGFDVTPARLVTGIITERGICEASEAGLKSLFA